MKNSLTICYITARKEPHLPWFFYSLLRQTEPDDDVRVIVVDFFAETRKEQFVAPGLRIVPCKPNVWQGAHRLTSADYWAVSAYRNTGACLCETEWLAVCDDRCVLAPTYLQAIRDAMEGEYAVAGAYEKRYNMTVERGEIISQGMLDGRDPRATGNLAPRPIRGGGLYGCTSAMPLEWILEINGWDESCDSLGLEDSVFGEMLQENGRPIYYDERMMIVEDRTPGESDSATKRTDKGISPRDKSHGILDRTRGKRRATHDVDLRAIRDGLKRGEPFPIPTGPTHDWWDGQPLSEFK